MGKIKRTFKTYAAWNFDKEIEQYNQMSEKGWHAIKMGCFHQTYEWDDTISYRFQIDYNALSMDERYRYITTFEEQGWEYINSTFNGWHAFRKKYRPELPEEEYEIYTDNSSKNEMLGRWMRLAGILSLLAGFQFFSRLWTFVAQISLANLCFMLEFLLALILLGGGWLSMRRMRAGRPAKRRSPAGITIMGMLIMCVLALVLMFHRPVQTCSMKTSAGPYLYSNHTGEDYVIQFCFQVSYHDFYYLTWESKNDVPLKVAVIDEDGNVVKVIEGENMEFPNVRLNLTSGTYSIGITVDDSVSENENIDIHYELR